MEWIIRNPEPWGKVRMKSNWWGRHLSHLANVTHSKECCSWGFQGIVFICREQSVLPVFMDKALARENSSTSSGFIRTSTAQAQLSILSFKTAMSKLILKALTLSLPHFPVCLTLHFRMMAVVLSVHCMHGEALRFYSSSHLHKLGRKHYSCLWTIEARIEHSTQWQPLWGSVKGLPSNITHPMEYILWDYFILDSPHRK